MGRGKVARVHLDATQAGWALAQGTCGMIGVITTADLGAVTCRVCLAKLRRGGASRSAPSDGASRAAPRDRASARSPSDAPLRAEPSDARAPFTRAPSDGAIAAALRAVLSPKAGPPPRITPSNWATSCKGGGKRCGACELCAWEREADRWAAVSPWTRSHPPAKTVGAPKWPSLAAALAAWAEWERHNRWGPSALGPMLARLERGHSTGGEPVREDALMRRASEMVRVKMALEAAYPEGATVRMVRGEAYDLHLSPTWCVGVLLARTVGVLPEVTPYEVLGRELVADIGVPRGELQAIVKRGRRVVTVELAARGLIPLPAAKHGLSEAIETAMGRLVAGD